MRRFLSYSQELEDLILYYVLKDVQNGFYIDVGANDPWNISVTKTFYERGFRGINVEPLKCEYNELVEDRPRDINLCVGAGDKEGELFLSGEGVGSSVVGNNGDILLKGGQKIPITTLSKICETYCDHNQIIHFCKIDVEGFEKEVLLGMDFKKYRPWIFVIEATEPGTSIPSYDKWEHILLDNEYELAYSYGINRYYVDKHLQGIRDKFVAVDILLKEYNVYVSVPRSSITKKYFSKIELIKDMAYDMFCLLKIKSYK